MKLKITVIAALLFAYWSGFALNPQVEKNTAVELKLTVDEDSSIEDQAKSLIKKQEELFKDYLYQLNGAPLRDDVKKFAKSNKGIFKNSNQFFLENKKIDSLLSAYNKNKQSYKKITKLGFKPIFKSLLVSRKKDLASIELLYRSLEKPVNVKTSADQYSATTESEVRTIVTSKRNAGKSIARYKLIMKWEGDIKNNDNLSTPALVTLIIQKIDFLTEEIPQMQMVATNLIEQYYQNLSAKNWDAVIIPQEWRNVLEKSVKIEADPAAKINVPLPDSRIFTVEKENLKPVKVNVDPAQFMEKGASYDQTNEAYYKLSLTFTIEINNDLKTGEIVDVKYREEAFKKPELKEEPNMQMVREEEAKKVVEDFAAKLIKYASVNAKEKVGLKAGLIEMFESKNSIVEVSHLRNDKEIIKNVPIEEYCSRLGVAEIIIKWKDFVLYPDYTAAERSFNQKFHNRNSGYCDFTDKRLHLKYDNDKEKFVITKISIERETTINCPDKK